MNRPILMLSYRLNGFLLGDRPLDYHVVNLLIHALNTCLVFLVLSRLLTMAGWIGKAEAGRSLYRKSSISDSSATNGIRELHSGPLREPRFAVPSAGIRSVSLPATGFHLLGPGARGHYPVWHRRQDQGECRQSSGHSLPHGCDVAPAFFDGRSAQELEALRPDASRSASCDGWDFSHARHGWDRGLLRGDVQVVSVRLHRSARHFHLPPARYPSRRSNAGSRFPDVAHHPATWRHLLHGPAGRADLCRDSLATPLSVGLFRLPDVSDLAGADLFGRAD